MANEKHPDIKFSNKFIANAKNEIKCLTCKTVYENQNCVGDFIVDIQGRHSVEVAFQSFFETEVVVDYDCVVCMKPVMVTKKTTLLSTPECLCITLNRFANRKKLKKTIDINRELSLECFADDHVRRAKYRLVSVISHIGQSCDSGHYIAIVNSEHNIYGFDDSKVHKRKVISGCNAYILFYERIEVIF